MFKVQKWHASKCHSCSHWKKDHMGKKKPAKTAAPPPKSSSPQTGLISEDASTICIWEWTDDSTNWMAFRQEDIDKVERGYQQTAIGDVLGSVDLSQMSWNSSTDQTKYRFDFKLLTQTNLSTQTQRKIRRRADVPCCPRRHELTYHDNYRFVCSGCNRTLAKEGYYRCTARGCGYNRCMRCAGLKMQVSAFDTLQQWQDSFERLCQAQLATMATDVSCSAELRKENLSILWRTWSDVGRSFEKQDGTNTTDLTFLAVAPKPTRPAGPLSARACIPFPAARTQLLR